MFVHQTKKNLIKVFFITTILLITNIMFLPTPVIKAVIIETAPSTTETYYVFATREGLVGGTTANGHVIQENDSFVALPSRKALCKNDNNYDFLVQITYKNRTTMAPVWDVGPWNTHDNYWDTPSQREMWKDLPQGKPEAQAAYQGGYNSGKDEFDRTVLNPAGIDLADGIFWNDLGMTDNDWVEVIFLWETYPLYDRTGAAGYADTYCNDFNPDYHDYSLQGGDCANFVSQCLISGGVSLWRGADGDGGGVGMDINRQGTLINCDYLSANLIGYQPTHCSYIEDTGVPPDNLTVGDVIIYGDGTGMGLLDDSLSGSSTGYFTGGGDVWRAVDFHPDERPVLTRVEIELGITGDGVSTTGTLQIRESNESGTPKPVDGSSNCVVSKTFSKPSGNSWITIDFNDVFDDIILNTSKRYWVCVNTLTSVVWVSTGVGGNRATSMNNAATWDGYATLTEYNFRVYTANTVDHYRHAVIVVEGNGSSCEIDAHSSSQYHTSWDYIFPITYNRINFYHFIDTNVTNYTQIRVNTTALNVRIGPSVQYPYDNAIGQIHQGEEYVAYEYIINKTGVKWWHIWYDYRNGWCSDNYVGVVVNNNSLFRVQVQTALNVRTGPGISYGVINTTFDGQMFVAHATAQNGSTTWYNFCYRGRNDAWCSEKYLYFISREIVFYFDEGWNLISPPVCSPYHDAESLRSNITNCTAVSIWNTTTQAFNTHTVGSGNFNISSDAPFMVYINTTNVSFKIVGTPIPTTPATYIDGWNTGGRFNTTDTNAESLAQNITNCTAIAYWNSTLCRFITHPVGTDVSNFSIKYGQGVFVFVEKT